MTQVDARFHRQMLTAVGVLIVSLLLSYFLSSRLQKFVSLTDHEPGDDRRAHFAKPRLLDPRREGGR